MKYLYLKLKSLFLWTEEAKMLNACERLLLIRDEHKKLRARLNVRYPEANKTSTHKNLDILPYKRVKADGQTITVNKLNLH